MFVKTGSKSFFEIATCLNGGEKSYQGLTGILDIGPFDSEKENFNWSAMDGGSDLSDVFANEHEELGEPLSKDSNQSGTTDSKEPLQEQP
eukprot:UN14682